MAVRFNPSITVGYARVSTQGQFVKGNALERYIEDMVSAGIEVYFTDVESGGSEDREGFNSVLSACRNWAKVIAVPDFTRFQRSVSLWEKVRPELTRLGIEIRDLYTGAPIGFRTAEEIRQSQIKTADAEFIRNYAAEQSIRGFERMRRQRRPFHAIAGLKIVNNQLVINTDLYQETGKTYQQIALEYVDIFLQKRSLSASVNEFCDRYGYTRIGHRANDFPRNHNTLKKWLQHPLLRGHQPYLRNGVDHRKSIFKEVHAESKILYNNHEALFSPDLARQIDEALSSCLVGQKVCTLKNPLTGLVFCAGCGSEMYLHNCFRSMPNGTRKEYSYIYCWGARPMSGDPRICDRLPSYGLSLEKLIDAVIEAIVLRADEIAQWQSDGIGISHQESSEVTELRNQISTLEALQMPDLLPIINEKRGQLSALILCMQNETFDKSELIRQIRTIAGRAEFWRSLSVQEQKRWFARFVEKVVADRGQLSVTLHC